MTIPLHQVWAALEGDPAELPRLQVTGPPATLRSTFAVTEAATAGVGASLLAATLGTDVEVGLDTRGLAVALRSERHLLRDGRSPGGPFDPLSAFHRTTDGWLRMHANYPWHRAAALQVLDCAEAEAPAAIAQHGAVELETALHAAGGVGAAVRTEPGWRALVGPPPPLVEHVELGPAPARAGARPRVLDLTRVIAGPVGTRTLAAHGADVLRLDPPDRPELALQYWDTLPGKRSALLDLGARPDVLEELLAGADVVVTGYRPGALDRYGLAPEALAQRHPGLVVISLSAWGYRGPWAGRRGFDSLVQAACAIAVAEGSAAVPGALPAQALDHVTGYLVAAAALLTLARQRRDGGSHLVRLSLVGTAGWLQRLPRAAPEGAEFNPAPYLVELDAPDGRLTLAAPPAPSTARGWLGPTRRRRSAPRSRAGPPEPEAWVASAGMHLVQLNIGRLVAPLTEPQLAGFVAFGAGVGRLRQRRTAPGDHGPVAGVVRPDTGGLPGAVVGAGDALPSVADALERLAPPSRARPAPFAFTFRSPFPAPGAASVRRDEGWFCPT